MDVLYLLIDIHIIYCKVLVLLYAFTIYIHIDAQYQVGFQLNRSTLKYNIKPSYINLS